MPGSTATSYNLAPRQVNAYDLASMYLANAGLPNTAKNRVALASWFLAESAHGSTPGTIVVYNNNPLNITTHGTNYHQFSGNTLHFANYSTPESGASAWWNLLNSNPNYRGIVTALNTQDQIGLASAVGKSPWGTSTQGILNVLKANGVDLSTGTGVGAVQDANHVYLNYGISYEIGTVFSQGDADKLYNTIVASGQTSGFDLGISNQILRAVINSYVGQTVSHQMFFDMGQKINNAGGQAADLFNPIPKVAPGTNINPLDALGNLLDKNKIQARLLHTGAIVLGVGLILGGIWILIKGVNRPQLNAGGGGNITVIEDFSDEPEEVEADLGATRPTEPKPIRKSRTRSVNWEEYTRASREQEERMKKANAQGSSTTYQGA